MKLAFNIWKSGSFVLVCLHFNKGERQYSAALINKKIIDKEVNFQLFDSIEEVFKHFGTNKAYQLYVSGNGVLNRMVGFHPNYKEDLIVSGNPDDFYFTSFNDGQQVVVSFFRKELIIDELERIYERKVSLLNITSGESALFMLLNEDGFIDSEYHIEMKAGKMESFSRNEINRSDKIEWQWRSWNLFELIGLTLFTEGQTPDDRFSSSYREESESVISDYSAKRKFQVFGAATIIVILLALLANYFYMNALNNDIAQLESDLSVSNENLALLDRLEQEKLRKEQLVLNAGVTSTKFLSYYLDEIGAEVPSQITLQSLMVFPLISKLKDKQKVDVDQHRIELTGITQNNEVLDDWIERMDRFSWVQGIELMNYLKNETGTADFKLEIRIGN